MGDKARNPRLVHFADCMLDMDTAELHRDGTKTSLQTQPFQALIVLLENRGQLVTREELINRLWPAGTFVDFDQSLNKAVARLREALGDNAEQPRYIETLSRRGYRWIAPVETDSQAIDAEETQVATGTQTWRLDKFAKPQWVFSIIAILLIGLFFWPIRKAPLPTVREWVQITNNGLAKGSVVTDGTRLYFEQGAGSLPFLAQASTEGGEVARISLPFDNVELWDISPNKSELLLGVNAGSDLLPNGELWVLPIAAGPPHRISSLLGHDACWAPNGSNIAYANFSDLYFANADGTQARKLATTVGVPLWCRFSPDGARIRFTVVTDNSLWALWEVTTDGKGLHRLRDRVCCGSWSADGKYYFFENGADIWVTRGDNSNLDDRSIARLTNGPLQAGSPVPSLDGKGLFVIGMQFRGELSRFDLRSKAVASFLNGVSAGEVSISPDRKWAAYVSYLDFSLWRSRVDGSERLQLTLPPIQAAEPQWSPNGKEIMFTDRSRSKIFVIGSESGSIHQLMPNENAEITGSGTWSPDGGSIVFVRGSPRETAIYQLDLQTGHISMFPGSERMYSARLSPTGRYVSAIRNSQDSLMLYDMELGTWSELAHGGNFDCNSWSRDGKFVHINNRVPKEPLIIERIQIADHKRERIAALKDRSTMGWVSFDGEDSIIFTRDESTHEIYRLNLVIPRF